VRPEQVGDATARLRREPNQKGIDIVRYDPVMTFTDGVKETVRDETTPLTSEVLVHEQEAKVDAEYDTVVNEDATVVAPEIKAKVMD